MEHVTLGAGEEATSNSASAAVRVQAFLDKRWEGHEQILSSAQEAVGHAVGQLTRAELCKFSAAANTLFKSVLKPEAESILKAIDLGHMKLGNPNKEQREALTSKLYNMLTAAHVLVSTMTISGTKVLILYTLLCTQLL